MKSKDNDIADNLAVNEKPTFMQQLCIRALISSPMSRAYSVAVMAGPGVYLTGFAADILPQGPE